MAKTALTEIKYSDKLAYNYRNQMRVLECNIWPALLYGAKTWTISRQMEKKLEAAEMWFIWRMMKISQTETKTNEEVLAMTNTNRKLIKNNKRQLTFSHKMRINGLENLITTRNVQGCRARGRQTFTSTQAAYCQEGQKWIKCNNDKNSWRSIVANATKHST